MIERMRTMKEEEYGRETEGKASRWNTLVREQSASLGSGSVKGYAVPSRLLCTVGEGIRKKDRRRSKGLEAHGTKYLSMQRLPTWP